MDALRKPLGHSRRGNMGIKMWCNLGNMNIIHFFPSLSGEIHAVPTLCNIYFEGVTDVRNVFCKLWCICRVKSGGLAVTQIKQTRFYNKIFIKRKKTWFKKKWKTSRTKELPMTQWSQIQVGSCLCGVFFGFLPHSKNMLHWLFDDSELPANVHWVWLSQTGDLFRLYSFTQQ